MAGVTRISLSLIFLLLCASLSNATTTEFSTTDDATTVTDTTTNSESEATTTSSESESATTLLTDTTATDTTTEANFSDDEPSSASMQQISGLKIDYPVNSRFGDLTIFNISLTSGSNHTTTVVIDDQKIVACENSNTLVFEWTYNFTKLGAISLEIIIANAISNMSQSVVIFKYYAMNGISMTNISSVYNSTENVTIGFYIDSNADKPQGSINYSIAWDDTNYSDGTLEVDLLGEADNSLHEITPPGKITHSYTIQGNYTVVVILSSLFDSFNQSFNVYVWDQLTVALNSTTKAKVNEIITFSFLNPPNSNFRFFVTYGDGSSVENLESDLYRGFDNSSLKKFYVDPGIYYVTMKAWNPFYNSSTAYQINVTAYTPLRLRGGAVHFEGTVEVFFDGKWYSLCDTGFDANVANIVCFMAGYARTAATAHSNSSFGVYEESRMEITCGGQEWDIADCSPQVVGSSCPVAGVHCSLEDVFMLKLSYGQDPIVSLLSGQDRLINLDYVAEVPLIEAKLNNHTTLSGHSVQINEINKTVQLNLTSTMLTVYGTSSILFRLFNGNNTKEISVEVNFEEDISQFEVEYSTFIEYGKPNDFNVSVASGSNLHFTWNFGHIVINCNYTGNGLQFYQFNHTFTSYGDVNISVVASNGIASATKSFSVIVFNKINGIFINTSKPTYETLEIVDINLMVADDALQPQGQVNASIDFGNGNITYCVVSVNDTYLTPHLYFNQTFDIQGNYSVKLVLRSYGDTLYQTIYLQIWDELNVTLSSVTEGKVDVDIEYRFGSTPRSNFMYFISYGDGTDIQNNESDLYRTYDFQSWNKSFKQPGIYNVSLTSWNPVHTSFFSYLVKITQDQIMNYTLEKKYSEEIQYMYGESKEILIYFETRNNTLLDLEFECLIGDTIINSSNIVINQTEAKLKSIHLPLHHLLYDIPFGNHSMNLTLYAQNRTEIRSIVVWLFYEEEITGLQILYKENVEVGTLVMFNATIKSGSNYEVEWVQGNASTVFFYSGNDTRSLSYSFTLFNTGDINATVFVKNLVSSQNQSVLYHSYYRINGIVLHVGETYETTETAEIAIKVNDSAKQPQGQVVVFLDFGDNSSVSTGLSVTTETLKSGFNTTRMYSIQGNYTITANITSPIGSEMLSSVVYVWDKLAVNLSSEMTKKVFENITFEFQNTPNSNFMYIVTYGDGDFRQNEESDLFRPYDLQSWNKSFAHPNDYNISLYAWNPLYNVFHSYMIHVTQDQITNFACEGNQSMPIVLISKSTVDVHFNFSTLNDTIVPDLLFKAFTNNISIDTNGANIDQTAGRLTFSMDSTLMRDLSYGVYEIKFVLLAQNETEEHLIDMAIIYEQQIEDIMVEYNLYTEVGHPLEFNVTIINGSNLNTEWFLGPTDKLEFLHPCNDTRLLLFNHTFKETGEINVTVVGKNPVSEMVKSFVVYYYYPIDGFILLPNTTVQTIENATIILRVENTANQPQGLVDIEIDYGDGSLTNISLDASDSKLANGVPFSHHYVHQGDYTVTAMLKSHINRKNLSKIISIWDKLNVKLAPVAPTRVDDEAEFSFISTPNSNFMYNVSYDDGTFITNKESDLYYHYNFTSWNKSYSQPKKYYNVTVKAWNPQYTSHDWIHVLIEYPLHEGKIGMSPGVEMIPRPDGRQNITMSLLENLPDPSNVVCTFDNDENDLVINYSISRFGFNHPVKRNYTFQTDGDKNVTFTCHNSVSRYQGYSLIKVRSFTADDFNYTFLNPVNMNMSLVETVPSDGIHFPFKPKHDAVNVTFNLTLFECSRLPPNIETVWLFGDGTNEERLTQTEFEYVHEFTKRGNYTMTFRVMDHNYDTNSTRVFNITLGTMIMFADKLSVDLRRETFTLTATKMLGNASYEFQIDVLEDKQTFYQLQDISNIYEPLHGYSTRNVSLKFYEYGFYLPKVTGFNGTVTEIVYLENTIIADYNITGEIELVADPSDWKVVLPPGEVKFFVSIINKTVDPLFGKPKRPFTHCNLISGDYVDRSVYNQVFNITADTPMLYNYTYISLGNLTVSITCSNNISAVTMTRPIYVGNECYSKVGLFDRKYSMPNESLVVSTATDVYLYSRMSVNCIENNIKYNWTIRKTDEKGSDLSVVHYDNPLGTNTATYLFTNGSLDAGRYKIELNVTLSMTYFHEYTYMFFKDPPPFSYISGGYTKTISSNPQVYEFDASHSHDGKGQTGNINYQWICKRISDTFPFDNHEIDMARNMNQGAIPCPVNTYTDKTSKFEIRGFSSGQTYEVTVNVSLKNNTETVDTFTQVLVVSDSVPVLSLRCSKNCLSKVGVASQFALRGHCSNCESSGPKKLSSEWKLWIEKDSSSDKFTEVANFTNMTVVTGIFKESVIIEANQLEMGRKYLVAMKGLFNDTSFSGDPNYIHMIFKTNFPPYNGRCNVNTSTDTINRLNVDCIDWLDEGLNQQRDPVSDVNNGVLLQYQYETQFTKNTSFGVQTITNYLYKGGESTIQDVPVQAGDNFTDYNVTVLIKIMDEYGDFYLFQTNIRIIPPEKSAQVDVNTVGAFFNKVMTSYQQAKAGGNDMSAVGVLGAAASNFDNVTNTTSIPTEAEVLAGRRVANDDTMNPIINPVEDLYTKKLKEILAILKSEIGLDCTNNPKRFSITDIQRVFGSLDSLTRLTQYIPLDVLEDLTGFIYNMTNCLEGVVNLVTDQLDDGVTYLPVQYNDIVKDISTVALRLLNTVMDKMLPEKLQNLDEDLILEDIVTELELKTEFENKMNAHLGISNVTNYKEKASQVLLVRQHVRSVQQTQVNLTRSLLQYQQETIGKLQEMTFRSLALGEKSLFSTSVLDVVTQKITPDDRDETYVKNFETNKTEIAFKVIVYKRNPYNYVENASSLTTGVSSIDLGPDAIVDSVIKNPPVPEPVVYEPKIQTSYPEPMIYYKFEVQNDGDAGVIFFKPENFDINSNPNDTLYSFYFSSVYFPRSSDFEVVVSAANWSTEDDGFKIFLDGGVCNSGICYMGIKLGEVEVTETPSESSSSKRRKRDTSQEAANATAAFIPTASNFSMAITTTGCRSYDKDTDTWTSNNCEVLRISTKENTVCRCPGTTFSSTFVVPLNTIDFANVWGKFDPTNAAVYGTLIAFLVIYTITALYLRRQDKKDEEKWATHFLSDTDGGDSYFYLLTVYTGMRKGAGTLSNVNFIVSGDEADTGIRSLKDGVRKGFATASVNKYIMGNSESLGNLTHIRVWHDNSGPKGSQSWYLNRIVVDDLHTQERYIFLCDKWLSIEEEDGMIDRILPVSSKDDITSFNTLFSEHAQSNITEQHLWLSMFIRPQRSIFTRVQRLSCILALLFLTMIANAMFFRSSNEDKVDGVWQVGVIRISVTTIIVSVIGISITTPPVMFITFAFRKSRATPPKIRKAKKNKPIATISHTENLESSSGTEVLDLETEEKRNENDSTSENGDESTQINLEHLLENNTLPLPHWVRRIAWFVVFMSVLSSAFFLLLYSMEWGQEKSEEWLSSFLLSFFESLLCVDPLKVLLISAVFAFIFKKMADESVPPKVDFEKLQTVSRSQFRVKSREGFNALVNNIVTSQKPLSEEQVAVMRKKRQDERTARTAMLTLLIYAIYVSAIYSISYMERDQRGYRFKQSLDDYMHSAFSKVSDTDGFFSWLNDSLLPTYFPKKNYANQTIFFARDLQYFSDNVSIRIGPPRLRQVRMGRGDCEYSQMTWPYPCYDRYSMTDEDDKSYCAGWTPSNESCLNLNDKTSNAWKFTSALDIWGIPKAGEYNTYSGGGYIISLKETITEAMDIVNDLLTKKWIDRQTRAVFLEFTLYNPNVNLFAYVMFLTEFTELGRVLTWYESEAFRPVSSAAAVGSYVIACYSIFIAYVMYSFVKFIRGIRNMGCPDYLKHPWHYVDMIMAFLGLAAIGVYIVRIQTATKAMDLYYDQLVTGSQFINFANVVIWDNTFSIIFAILVFVSIIQFLRILGYSKKVTEIISVITNVGRDLYGFLIMFSVMFFTFVGTGYLLFGSTVKEYKSFFSVIGSLTNTFIGVNSLDALVESDPAIARLFYFMYILLVIMTLFTIFAAILNKSISDVKEESAGIEDVVGVMDIVMKSAKSALSFVPSVGKRAAENEKQENWSNLQDDLRKGNVSALNVMRLVRETFSDIEGVHVQAQPAEMETKSMTGIEEFILNVDRGNTEVKPENPTQKPREEFDEEEKKVRFKFL